MARANPIRTNVPQTAVKGQPDVTEADANIVEQTVRISARPETVWRYWTDPQRMCDWWGQQPNSTRDPAVCVASRSRCRPIRTCFRSCTTPPRQPSHRCSCPSAEHDARGLCWLKPLAPETLGVRWVRADSETGGQRSFWRWRAVQSLAEVPVSIPVGAHKRPLERRGWDSSLSSFKRRTRGAPTVRNRVAACRLSPGIRSSRSIAPTHGRMPRWTAPTSDGCRNETTAIGSRRAAPVGQRWPTDRNRIE